MTGDAILGAIGAAHAALEQAGVRHVLIGGAAMPAWGRSRATADADFLLNLEFGTEQGQQQTAAIVEAFRKAGFAHMVNADRRRIDDKWILHFWFPVRDRGFSIRVDLILVSGPEGKQVLERAVLRQIDGVQVSVASCEDLILLKLAAGRPIDVADAVELLAIHAGRLDMEYLRRQARQNEVGDALKQACDQAKRRTRREPQP